MFDNNEIGSSFGWLICFTIQLILFLMQIWITKYNRTEKYAAGFLVCQSHGDDGLPVWSNKYVSSFKISFNHITLY